MIKSQLITTLLAVAFCVLLAFAPKYVVDNDTESLGNVTDETVESSSSTHTQIPENIQQDLSVLKIKLEEATIEEEGKVLLDSIVVKYNSVNLFDSAAFYAEMFANQFPSGLNYTKAGDLYYEAYTYAVSKERVAELSSKVREVYDKVNAFSALPLNAKVRLGMTYVSGENPMQGITMIREVLNEDPENNLAILNLGILSMQSGQYDRAVKRFEKLIQLAPENIQARFYLGISYMESGNNEKAKEQLTFVKENETDSEIIKTVETYLIKLK